MPSHSKKFRADELLLRQKLCESDTRYDPLCIFPEGGTTNGEYLINFKRGAFVGGTSIWPKIHKWSSRFQSVTTGVVDGLPHYLIGGASLWNSCTKIELPVFRPNEYFYEHH